MRHPTLTDRTAAASAGILFITAILCLFVGEAVYRPVLNGPDVLERADPERSRLLAGLLIEWIATVPLIVLIPVLLFPILARVGLRLAIAYVVFRALEVATLTMAAAGKLAMVELSAAYIAAPTELRGSLAGGVEVLRAVVTWVDTAGLLSLLFFVSGALVLFGGLRAGRLVPAPIALLGLAATVLLAVGAVWASFVPLPPEIGGLIWGPMALAEIVLAGWLIARGVAGEAASPER